MFDFTSPFWNLFITVTVVLSFIGIVWLIRWMSVRKKHQPGVPVEATGHVWDGDLQELNNPLPGWWLMLFYITLVFGAVYLVLYPGLGTYRGLLGYTGTVEGVPVSVQTTMMGTPTTTIVVEELLMLGVETFIRVGTCGGYGRLGIGDVVVAMAAASASGIGAMNVN